MKKKLPLYIIVVLLLYILQTTLFNYIKIMGAKPNLLLVFVCVMSYLRNSKEGMILGLFTGLFVDIMSARLIGVYALVFMLAGFILGSIPRKLFWDNVLIIFIFSIIIMIPSELLVYCLYKVTDYIAGSTEYLVLDVGKTMTKVILPEMLYNIIVFPAICWLGNKLDRFFDKDIRAFVK